MKIFIFFLIFLQVGQVFAASFSDTDLSFYRDSIETLADEGIISGYGDGRFGPDNTITRAEILKVLLGTTGLTPPDVEASCFPDVDTAMWYHPYICE